MTYADELAAVSRTPIYLVRITLDFCDRTFGVAPCNATGTECYNTFPTCIFTTAYLHSTGKVYKFTSADAPAPFNTGERPYLRDVDLMPTEIQEDKTVTSRINITLLDEADEDIGVDPYVANRSSVQGTFWRKLLARNPNYVGRKIEILEGFAGLTEAGFVQKFIGQIKSIRLGRGTAIVEAADKLVDLTKIYLPAQSDIRLRLDHDASQTTINLDSTDGLGASGYVRVNDEIIQYGSIIANTNSLVASTRGAFGTTAAAHDEGDKVQNVYYMSPQIPKTQIGTLITAAGLVPNVDYDTASFIGIDKPDVQLPKVELIQTKPAKVSDLLFELLWHGDCQAWVGEDLKIYFARKVYVGYAGQFKTITDAANIVVGSVSANANEDERKTRTLIYWDKNPVAKDDDEVEDFYRLDMAIDADAESATLYNEERPFVVYSRFWRPSAETDVEAYAKKVANMALRHLIRLRTAPLIVDLEVELKDSGIKTGSFVRLETSDVQDRDGNAIAGHGFQVIRREVKGSKIALRLKRLGLRRHALIGANTLPEYSTATDDEKEYAYISNNSPNLGKMDDKNTDGYYIV